MRDLRVQEFLRELVVSVTTPSDLAGSIIVKIFHCGEGRDAEQVAEPRNKSLVFVIAYLSLSLVFYILHTLNCSYLHMLDITCA